MSASEIIGKTLVSVFTLGSVGYMIVYCARLSFLPRADFEQFLMNQSSFVRKFASWYKPSIWLNRIVYIWGLVLGIIVFLLCVLGLMALWKQ